MVKELENKQILVGVNGGISSLVTIYLLKKQGLDVKAIYFSFIKNNWPIESDIFERFYVRDIEKLKKILNKYGIPLLVVSAEAEFALEIVDPVIASRLMAQEFPVKAYFNKLLFRLLREQASKHDISAIATGHYAKISIVPSHNILVANEVDYDQSSELVFVDYENLRNVDFPLAELRLSEIKKIIEHMGVSPVKKSHHEYKLNLLDHKNMDSFIVKKSPIELRKSGHIINYLDDSIIGEHQGSYLYRVGQNILPSNSYVVKIDSRSGNVYVANGPKVIVTDLFITKVNYAYKQNCSRPLDAYIKLQDDVRKYSAKIYFKSNRCILIELNEAVERTLAEGTLVTIYSNDGQRSRLIAGGLIKYAGSFKSNKIKIYSDKINEIDERPISEKEKKYLKLDFWY